MSLVFNSRDVSAGPTLGLDIGLSTPPAHDQQQDLIAAALTSPSYLSGLNSTDGDARTEQEFQSPTASARDLDKSEASSDSTSSIGVPSGNDDDSEGEDGEAQSKLNGSLSSLASLEDSLPIKRGLSSYFCGKSKSFASLSDVKSVKEMEKPENPLNKRRRLMIVSKWSKKSSFYSWKNPTSMPLLALNEEDEETNDGKEGDDDSSNENEQEYRKKHSKGFMSCFSLTDL